MKKNHDFSKGEHGKFYHEDAVYHLPIYLDSQIEEIIRDLAQKKNTDTQTLVNDWLKNNIKVIQSVLD
ncbi:MAG: hypothetical protein JXB48_21865 [Candidatus Latescibacteria bacterium]|nr:hypothetical protein [Candidatus Latescibacterota bacterium]